MHTSRSTLAAVVAAGGRARRLGGRDKPMIEVGGVPMLRTVVTAALAAGASPCVVVGPERDGFGAATFVREDPAGGGPVAAIATGLSAVGTAHLIAVLAGDLPFLSEEAIRALAAAVGTDDGALFVDEHGRRQLLCGVWRTEALRAAVARLERPDGASLRALVAGLAVNELTWNDGRPWFDCDTEDDLRRAGKHDLREAGHDG